MNRSIPVLALAVLAASPARAQAPPSHKVFVAPYQAVGGGGAGLVAGKLTDGLRDDLSGRPASLHLLRDAVAPAGATGGAFGGGAAEAQLSAARTHVKVGAGYLETGRFEDAMGELAKALVAYEANLAFLKSEGELVDLYLKLASAAFQSGYEDDGEKALKQALVMDSELEVAGKGLPPLFERLAKKFRRRFGKITPGVLALTSNPTPATVFVNGREVGATPLELNDLLPGNHYVRMVRPMSGTWARRIRAPEPGKRAELLAELPPIGGEVVATADAGAANRAVQDSVNEVSALLASGKADGTLKDRAYELALRLGATHVVVGYVTPSAASYTVRTMMLRADPRALADVDRAELDPELLDLGLKTHGIAGSVVMALDRFPEGALVPDVAPVVAVAPPVTAAVPPAVDTPPAILAPPPVLGVPDPPAEPTPVAALNDPVPPGTVPATMVSPPPPEPPQTFVLEPPPIPAPPPPPPPVEESASGVRWYGRWWVWTAVGVVAVGGVAAAVILAGDDLGAGEEAPSTFRTRVSW